MGLIAWDGMIKEEDGVRQRSEGESFTFFCQIIFFHIIDVVEEGCYRENHTLHLAVNRIICCYPQHNSVTNTTHC